MQTLKDLFYGGRLRLLNLLYKGRMQCTTRSLGSRYRKTRLAQFRMNHITATGNHVTYEITHPPGSGDFPALPQPNLVDKSELGFKSVTSAYDRIMHTAYGVVSSRITLKAKFKCQKYIVL